MKKIVSIVLAFVLVLGCFCAVAFADSTTKVTFDKDTVQNGDTVVMTITLPERDDLKDIAALGMVITYDKAAFEYVSISSGWMADGDSDVLLPNWSAADAVIGSDVSGMTIDVTFKCITATAGTYGFKVEFDSESCINSFDSGMESVSIPAASGNVKVEAAPCDHSYDAGVVTTEPTCTEKGVKTYTCSKCSATKTEDIAAKGHTEVVDAAVEATCTEAGKTEGKHCSVCEAVIKAQEVVPAKGHTEVVDAAVEATCTEAGKTEGKHCSVCEAVIKAQEVVPAKGHTEVVDAAVDATCTKDGKTAGKHCSACNEILVAQETIPAKGHTEVIDAAVAATCTEAGKTEGKHCSVCNEVLVAQETIPATGHKFADDAKCDEACACINDGCDYVKPAGEHSYDAGKVTKEATCTEKGVKTFTCTVCGDTKTEDIAATGHTEVVDAAVDATCTKDGKTEGKHCSACGEVFVAQETIAAKGHTEVVDAAVEATCTEDGKTEGKHCSVCNEVLVAQETVPAKGHKFADEWTVVKEATCTEAGLKTNVCAVCQATVEEAIPALGHDYKDGKCVVCGAAEPVNPPADNDKPADNKPADNKPVDGNESVPTGDAGVAVWCTLLAVSAVFGTAIVMKKREA